MGDETNVDIADQSVNRTALPYRAEYALSGRAKCKRCEMPIEKASLKMSVMVPSRFHAGQDAKAHHFKCFFEVRRPKSIAEISHFNQLRFEDQELIEKAIATNASSVLKPEDKEKKKNKKDRKSSPDNDDPTNYNDFRMEYAKSNRSTCVICQEKIPKGDIRICTMDYENTQFNGVDVGPTPRWHHVDCFASAIEHIDFFGSIKKIPGYKDLEKNDKKIMASKFKQQKKEIKLNDVKKEEPEKNEKPRESEEERALRKQSKKFFYVRDYLSTMKKEEIRKLLRDNNQKSDFKNGASLLDQAADMLLFGAVRPCEVCGGSFILSSSAYICTGTVDGVPCKEEESDPVRDEPIIPDEIMDKYDFFQNDYKFRNGKRLFATKMVKAVEKKEQDMLNPINPNGLLYGLKIGVSQWKNLKPGKEIIEKKLNELGASAHTSFNSKLFVMLASKEEMETDSQKLEVCKEAGIPIVTPGWLFQLKKLGSLNTILSKSLLSVWKGDFHERYNELKGIEQKPKKIKLEK